MQTVGRRLTSVLIVALLVAMVGAALFTGAASAGAATPTTGPVGSVPSLGGGQPIQPDGDDTELALSKIETRLQEAAQRPQKGASASISVLTTDYAAARRVAAAYGATLGVSEDVDGMARRSVRGAESSRLVLRDLTVPESALLAIAKLPSTLAISKSVPPKLTGFNQQSVEYREWEAMRPLIRERLREAAKERAGVQGSDPSPVPFDYGTAIVTGSQAVKATYGYTGSAVNVMVLDTGTDFAHPNLAPSVMGGAPKYAMVNDPTSPWDGWPIMSDMPSLDLWLAQWSGGLPPYPLAYSFGESTWYSDLAYEGQLVGTPLDVTIDGDPTEWDAAHLVATDPAEGANGEYDITDLYVSGGYDANLGLVGHFFGFTTAPALTNSQYILYIDWMGAGTPGYDVLFDNNFATAGQVLIANTAWDTSATLTLPANTGMIGDPIFSLDDGTVFTEGTDYTYNPGTGIVTFFDPLYPGFQLLADYAWGWTNVMGSAFTTRNIDTGSATVYLNGAVWPAAGNYALNEAAGSITFNAALAPGDFVESDYTYNAGGDYDPFYATVSSGATLPEVVVFWDPTAAAEPDVYLWQGQTVAWDGPYPISAIGGEAAFNAVNGFAEFFAPKANRDDPQTISVEMYSADTVGLVDTVPTDGTPLSNFAPADFGWLPYFHGFGGWPTKRAAPDLGDTSRINRNYHIDLANPLQVSASGTYRLGVHPDDWLTGIWGERVGVLLVDANTAGDYDTIFVDLDDDHSFADEVAVTKSQPVVYQDVDGDTVPDISGGILYFLSESTGTNPVESFTAVGGETSVNVSMPYVAVDFTAGYAMDLPVVTLNGNPLGFQDSSGAVGFDFNADTGEFSFWTYDAVDATWNPAALAAGDAVTVTYASGTPLPYAPTLAAMNGFSDFVPAEGDIALFYGEFSYGNTHGTSTASAVGGKPYGNGAGAFDIWGTAEDVHLIGGNFAGGTESLEMAALGYDGVAGTGDEAQIVSNSWCNCDTDLQAHSGWDASSRYLQYLSDTYPETAYMFAASNEGWGYGTINAPAAAADVISVGASGQMNYRRLFGFDGGPIGCWPILSAAPCGPYGDMADFSARGPTGLGQPKPDILADGAFGFAAWPLNSFGYFQGLDAWDLFSGTSWATPVAAGVAALTAESYWNSHANTWPTNEQLKEFLMSGASDHKFDSLQQGAGYVNAMDSVELASTPALNGDGVSVFPSTWTPGGYPSPADDHKMFVNLLAPGESDTDTFTLSNHGLAAASVTASDASYTLTGSYEWEFIQPAGAPLTSFTFGGTGSVTNRYRGTGGGFTLEASDFPAALWSTADFIAVHATVGEIDRIVAAGDTITPALELFQWVDVNDNGINDGASERTRITTGSGFAANYPVMKVWIRDPASRLDNGTSAVTEGVYVRVRDFGSSVPAPISMRIEFYERADWGWVTVSPTTAISVPSGGTATFDATASVPLGTAPGMYQGVLLVDVAGDSVVIPTVITVPYAGFPVRFGGGTPASSLYSNDAFRGQAGGQYTLGGDLRYFYALLDVDTTRPDRRMLYELNWQNSYSDAEVFAAASAPYAAGSVEEMDEPTYGPFTLVTVAQTSGIAGGQDANTGFQDLAAGDLQTGLVLVAVESLQLNGDGIQENFNVDVGMMETKPTTVAVSTNRLVGSAPLSVWANVPLYGGLASAVTESTEEVFADMPLEFQTDPGAFGFQEWLCTMRPPNTHVTTVAPGTIAVTFHITSPIGGDDHDLGIFRDENANGVCDWGVDTFMGQDADADADETVVLNFPLAGDYLVQAGWYASLSNTWTLEVSTTRIGVSAFSASNCPTTTVAPLTLTGCDVGWDFLGSTPEGVQQGTLFLSPGYAPFALVQQIGVSIRYDITAPTVADVLPLAGSTTQDGKTAIVATIDDGTAQISWGSVKLWIDGVDMTGFSKVIAPYTNGYPSVTVSLNPPEALENGVHTARVEAMDYAGNTLSHSWSWMVDNAAPMLTLTSSSGMWAQQGSALTVTGTTEPGATVALAIGGTSVAATVDPQGRFTGSLTLAPGENLIDVVATDAAGNTASQSLEVWYDDADPDISWVNPPAVTRADSVTIVGSVSEPVSLWVNGIETLALADGSWRATVTLLEGMNVISLRAEDASGRSVADSVTVNRVTSPPTIDASLLVAGAPTSGRITDADDNVVTVSGTATTAMASINPIRLVRVNGQTVIPGTSGTFDLADQPLNIGANTFVVEAEDTAGNVAVTALTVTFDPTIENVRYSYGSIIWGVVAVVLLIVGFLMGWMMTRPKGPEPEVMAPMEPAPAEPPSAPMEAPPEPQSPEELPPSPGADSSEGGAQ